MRCYHSKPDSHRLIVSSTGGTQFESQYTPGEPNRYVPQMGAMNIGKMDAKLDNDVDRRDKYRENTESKVFYYPEENRKMHEKKDFTENRDSKYVKSTVLDWSDTKLLPIPISKICSYFDNQYAVHQYNTNSYTTVDRDTLAIRQSTHLAGSHLTSNSIVVLDVVSIC